MQLTDAQWARIAPLMPTPRGNCKLPARQVLEGWRFITTEGCSWRALPARYGPWHTVYMRGRRWIDRGVLERVFAALQREELEAQLEQRGPDRPLRVAIDSTIVQVPQDGTGAPAKRGAGEKGRQAIGRSRGGLTTKLHALVLDDRLPLTMTLTPGHWGDAPWGRWLLERLGPQAGQPQLLADRADEGDQLRALAADLGWELVTPPKTNRVTPWPLNRVAYRARNAIERYFGRIKRLRGVATRYHKLARVYFNQILLACIHFMTK